MVKAPMLPNMYYRAWYLHSRRIWVYDLMLSSGGPKFDE